MASSSGHAATALLSASKQVLNHSWTNNECTHRGPAPECARRDISASQTTVLRSPKSDSRTSLSHRCLRPQRECVHDRQLLGSWTPNSGVGAAGGGTSRVRGGPYQGACQNLNREFGWGFGWRNLTQMRAFFLAWPPAKILKTPSAKSIPLGDLCPNNSLFHGGPTLGCSSAFSTSQTVWELTSESKTARPDSVTKLLMLLFGLILRCATHKHPTVRPRNFSEQLRGTF